MADVLFLRFIPGFMRRDILKSLRSRWIPSSPYRALPDGQLDRLSQTVSGNTINAFNNLVLDEVTLKRQLSPGRDRFERVTGVRLVNNPQTPVWQLRTNRFKNASGNDPVLDSRWLTRLFDRNGLTDSRSLPEGAAENPERYEWWRQLRTSIIDVFEGFFSSNNT